MQQLRGGAGPLQDAPRAADPRVEAISRLRVVGSVGGVGSVLLAGHLITGWGLPCPLLTHFGLRCPLCGSTRAAEALLRADPAGAWAYNPLFCVTLVLVGVLSLGWIGQALGGPVLHSPRLLRPLTQQKIYAAVGVIAVTFTVLRNLT